MLDSIRFLKLRGKSKEYDHIYHNKYEMKHILVSEAHA